MCRSTCTAEEWWGLVQGLLAADCGMDLRSLAHLFAGVVVRALGALQRAAAGSSQHAQAALDARRAQESLAQVARVCRERRQPERGVGAADAEEAVRGAGPEQLCAWVAPGGGSEALFLAAAEALCQASW